MIMTAWTQYFVVSAPRVIILDSMLKFVGNINYNIITLVFLSFSLFSISFGCKKKKEKVQVHVCMQLAFFF